MQYPQQPPGNYGQPAPMMPQQPPQRSGANVGLIIGIIVVVFVVGIVGVLFLFGVLGYMSARRSMTAARAASTATSVPTTFTQTYSTSNGVVTAHYPSDWAAKSIDHATLAITRNLGDGTDELVYVAGVKNPISDDVNEFSRVLINAMVKNIEATGDTWTETSRHRDTCFRTFSGLAVEGTFTAKGITKENVRMCFFMQTDRGYELKTMVPAIHESRDLPLLQSMIDATDVK